MTSRGRTTCDSPTYQPQRPGTVVVAAVLTFVTAAGMLLGSLFIAALALWLAAPLFEAFGFQDDPRWYVLGFAVLAVSLSLGASWLAWQVLRGRNWAGWFWPARRSS